MISLWQLPLDKIYCFLSLYDRVQVAVCCKFLHNYIKPSLTPEYDMNIAYRSCRSFILRPKKKKGITLPVVEAKNIKYYMLEDQIYSVPDILKSVPYVFECTEDGCSIFINSFGDKMIVHSSLLETIESSNNEKYECLTNADDLNTGIDFANPAMLIKRQKLLLEKISKNKAENEEILKKETLKHIRQWGEVAIILCHGGNFNIAGFMRNGKCMETHSDHKYVSRKKQGGRQMGADKRKGGSIHSKGADIRRENEKKHNENIENMIEESSNMLDRVSLIFLHAPGNNYYVFIGGDGYLEKWKHKIRSVGMTTNKAKFQETERVFREIATIKILFKMN